MSSVFQSEDTEQDAALGALQSFHRVESVQRLPMGGGKPFPELFKDRKAYVVEFDGTTDEWHPQNWPSSRRLVIHCKSPLGSIEQLTHRQTFHRNNSMLRHLRRNLQLRPLRTRRRPSKPTLLCRRRSRSTRYKPLRARICIGTSDLGSAV